MKRVCVIGWPIKHSRSPLIHGFWLKQLGIAGSYSKETVKPEELSAFLKALAANGYVGANVTIPHKEAALECALKADAAARAIGAANTLWLEGDTLCAGNTDAYGFMAHLQDSVPDWQKPGRPVTVIGAGGAARAILYGLISGGVKEIRLTNRTQSRAQNLAAHFGHSVTVWDWNDRQQALDKCGLLVNTTSLGMTGKADLNLDLANLPTDTVVADIVYTPLETSLLRNARTKGNPTVDGLGMLLHQAVPGFEKWFGIRPKVTAELRARIIADLDNNS